ncbi:MAG TPA: DUF3667 domain-containing protein, partial [Opitutaceae bacterium]|nr:DUF3667 domain-containing protein [Opitutaceae bacterium]
MEVDGHAAPTCKNCDTPLPGEYCPKCGQRDYDFERSFREIAAELAESFWSFDSKLLRGVVDLLLRPGFLTKEFLAGRRARQVPPLRFYLFVSILFFLTSSFDPTGEIVNLDDSPREVSFESLGFDPATTSRLNSAAAAIPTSASEANSAERRIEGFFRDRYERRHEAAQMIAENLPKLVFACLPVFALITRMVFRRAKLGFLSHLVMALHLHSFYFLFSLVSSGWAMLLGFVSPWLGGLVSFSAAVYTIVYAFVAARRVFGSSRAGTFWKSVLAGMLYLAALGIGFLTLTAIVFLI